MRKLVWGFCAIGVVITSMVAMSSAQNFYATNEYGYNIYSVDYATDTVTVITTTTEKPDDIILTPAGNLVYTQNPGGSVVMYNPTTKVSTVMGTALGGLRDLVLEPSGTSILVAAYAPVKILRMSLTAPYTVTTLASKLKTVNGLAYDKAGDLFAVADMNTVIQVNPVTGATIKTLVLEPYYKSNGGDGMCYDPYTNELWISHIGTIGNGLYEVPLNLSTATEYLTGDILQPDGIVSDGKGNLYIGGAYKNLLEYNIPSNTVTKSLLVSGIDSPVLVPAP